jgi:hypothetical protein
MRWWFRHKEPPQGSMVIFDPPLIIPPRSSVELEFRMELSPDGKSIVMGQPKVGEPKPLDKKGE